MQQDADKFLMFRNRLTKVYRHLSKQAKKQEISCYRLYNYDLPEFAFIIELYGDKLYVAEYKKRFEMSEDKHQEWLTNCLMIMSEVCKLPLENIYVKTRKRKENRFDQYRKINETKNEFIVQENGLQFIVNLTDYLDTGLFLDHRTTRTMVKGSCYGRKLLNLFCYTGSFTVYAIAGGAKEVVSVDLSKTYLDWTKRNVQLNFPEYKSHKIIHADVLQYLKTAPREGFDLIILDPPTFSNSKQMDDFLDIQQHHSFLINKCLQLVTPGGLIFFSTNYKRFQLNQQAINSKAIKDITKLTTPFDFSGKFQRYCYVISNL
ncbi:MAG TPA: class I SAM-dependent methyltransferase [Chitinophagaceae bacterium]|nr:class I SAM-dependent methyltransferase [Chitinophagaceae bacterium]